MHLIVIAVLMPQIQEQIVGVIKGSADATDPGEDCVVVRLRRHERQHVWTCPQPPEQNVDVIKVILQEQCQRMRFFYF